mmetsp:Transcript_91882/g.291510  ORF Transcript_91882/g.291510 Transcript_91882/m.291510 type:complete len:198 (+) Transcript_91882:71-664(+)
MEADLLSKFGRTGTTPCGVTYAVTDSGRFITADLCEPPVLTPEQANQVLDELAKVHGTGRVRCAVEEALTGRLDAESEEVAGRLLEPEQLLEPSPGLAAALEPALLTAEAGLLQVLGQGVDRHGRWMLYGAVRHAATAAGGPLAERWDAYRASNPLAELIKRRVAQEQDRKKSGAQVTEEDFMQYLLDVSFGGEPPG